MTIAQYRIDICVDTGKPALYRKVYANVPGAIDGWELLAHVGDFAIIADTLMDYSVSRGINTGGKNGME